MAPPLAPPATTAITTRPRGPYTVTPIALPDADPAGLFLDFLAFDPSTGNVWLPAGATGSREIERDGKKRGLGPSAAAIGNGVVYIGNRGDQSVCVVDAKTFAKRACVTLDALPDCVAYVADTDEVWVTTPRDKSLRLLDATTLAEKARLPFDGEPEGYAVDPVRHRFYTNLEDKDLTLAIDVKSRTTVATWHPDCGEQGPHGLRVDEADGLLFVACSAQVKALTTDTGAIVSSLPTGDGVDDLDYVPATRTLYVAAGRTAQLFVVAVDPRGTLSEIETVATKTGARNGVVDARGTVYLAAGPSAELLIVRPTTPTL